jgi:hypothetical protein
VPGRRLLVLMPDIDTEKYDSKPASRVGPVRRVAFPGKLVHDRRAWRKFGLTNFDDVEAALGPYNISTITRLEIL